MMKKICIFLIIAHSLFGQAPSFIGPKDLGIVDSNYIDEASGLVASHKNYGILWTHNDDTDEKRIFAINSEAKIVAIYYLKIDKWNDIEDIALSKDINDENYYIFIGDIGNNNGKKKIRRIIKLKEPKVSYNQNMIIDTISEFDIIEFEFPDNDYDSEAFFVDPLSNDIYIITKRLKNEKIFKIKYPQNFNKKNEIHFITNLPYGYEGFQGSGVTAADISFDGKEILIKTYSKVFYYRKNDNLSLDQVFKNDTQTVKYNFEPQGEAIAWEPNARGYYTLSELSPFNIPAHLYFYEKNKTSVKKKIKKKLK